MKPWEAVQPKVRLQYSSLTVWLLPCFADNYIFCIYNDEDKKTIVVDPGEGTVVERFLNQQGFFLNEIWITHHHSDHIDGVFYLKEKYACVVRGSVQISGRIPGVTLSVEESSFWEWGSFKVDVLNLPGHTRDHIGYWIYDKKHSLLFSGDVLFGLGCGRLFEGTFEQMKDSLNKIMALPKKTQVFCSHEYTGKNLEFTLSQAIKDTKIEMRESKIIESLRKGQPTVPLDLHEEMKTNLFLKALQSDSPLQEFRFLREKRDHF